MKNVVSLKKIISKVEKEHDFTSKLCQPSVLPRVMDYVNWQKRVRSGSISELERLPDSCMPISVNIDLTTACNFQCGHCIDSSILNTKFKHDHEKLIGSLENMISRDLKSAILIGGGEPTLYPEFRSIVRFLKENNIQVAVSSNGSCNNAIYDVSEYFCGNDWIRISLDAGSNNTFLQIHRPHGDVTLESICEWVSKIRVRNPKLSIGFSFVVIWEGIKSENGLSLTPNIGEIIKATKLARDYGFSYISLKPFLLRYEGGTEVMDPSSIIGFGPVASLIQEAVSEAKTYEIEDFKVVESTNLSALKEDTWDKCTRQPSMCHMQAFRQILSPLGLFSCPAFRGVEKARIGNKDILHGENNLIEVQRATGNILTQFDASEECREVTCIYNSVNWWIERAIEGKFDLPQLESTIEQNDYFL